MSNIILQLSSPAAQALNRRLPQVRPLLYALNDARRIRGISVGMDSTEESAPAIIVDAFFPSKEFVAAVHEVLRDDPHLVVDLTRKDAPVEA